MRSRSGGWAGAALLLALCGCGGGGAGQAAKEAASIAAGAQLAADLLASGAVPRVYTTQLAERLRGELTKTRQTLGADHAASAAAGRLDAVLGEMHRAAERDDRAGLRRAGAVAGGLARELSDAADSLQASEGGR
ncbi:MAG TPA: hypothetical protein VGO40_24360 [Longimicrobium sp.]|jgi:hypothetical protein|nr:hypothetical protein [Longimicrobium sp.]